MNEIKLHCTSEMLLQCTALDILGQMKMGSDLFIVICRSPPPPSFILFYVHSCLLVAYSYASF